VPSRTVSALVGAVATVTVVLSAFGAWPRTAERGDAPAGAWTWRAGEDRFVPVTPKAELHSPRLAHPSDGTLLAVEEGSTERFDPGTRSFVRTSEIPAPTQRAPDEHRIAEALAGTAGWWVERNEHNPLLLDPLTFHVVAHYAGDAQPTAAFASSNGATAVLTNTDGEIGLVTGKRGDTELRPVPLHGASLGAHGDWLAGSAVDGDRLLVVMLNSDTQRVTARTIDLASGDVSLGPPLRAPWSASAHWSLSGTWISGGGMLLVDNGERTVFLAPGLNVLLGLGLLAQLIALGVALKRRWLAPWPFVAGLALGVIPLGALAFGMLATVHR
jgi:hypothetical protein